MYWSKYTYRHTYTPNYPHTSDYCDWQAVKDSGGFQKLIAFITDVPAPDDDSKGDKSKKGGGDKNSRAGKKGGKGEEGSYVCMYVCVCVCMCLSSRW